MTVRDLQKKFLTAATYGRSRHDFRRNRGLRVERLESRQLLSLSVEGLGVVQPSPVPPGETYDYQVLAKAEPDEWFTAIGDVPVAITQPKPTDAARPKVNQDYVWGMAESNGRIYFSSSGNVLCQATGAIGGAGLDGDINLVHVAEGAQSQYPLPEIAEPYRALLGDWRPPEMHVYDPTKPPEDAYQNITPEDEPLLDTTLGLRSVGATDQVVLYAGPDLTYLGMNLFAFNARTNQYLGARHILQYSDTRGWANANGQLYTATMRTFSTTGEGVVLRWAGSLRNPFVFQEVGRLDLEGANICVHNNRLFVSTWPLNYGSLMGVMGYRSSATAGIWMSPELDSRGRLRLGSWRKVWDIQQYEVDPVIAQSIGMGSMASFDGYLYWGTMQVPYTGGVVLEEAYPGYIGSTSSAERAIAIFRCADFGSTSPNVELLYGDKQLYRFTPPPDPTTQYGVWTLTDNNTGAPLFGAAGFDNESNYYTWSMAVYDNRLYVGTFDANTILAGDYYVNLHGDVAALENLSWGTWMGGDLWCFFPDAPDGEPVQPFPVSLTGAGNPLNHGIRNMKATATGLYLGTANSSNLLTDAYNAEHDPLLKAGGWELVRLDIGQLSQPIDFTLSNTTVPEISSAGGSSSGTVVGALAVTDPQSTYTWSLPDNAGRRFRIRNDQLILSTSSRVDYETFSSHQVVVRVTDTATGASFDKNFTITLTDVPERPARIELSATWMPEDSLPGTVVANVSALDQDAGDTVAFTLLTNYDGAKFKLENNQLKLNEGTVLDYETAKTLRVRLRATDSYGLYRDTNFTIAVANVNEAPTGIDLSAATVQELSPNGTVVGLFSAIDPDAADQFTYTLVDSAGGRFRINGDQLQVNNYALLDYDASSSHTVVVRVSDSGSLSFTQSFTIDVTPAPPLVLTSMDVQQGATQRSYVRYVDLFFENPGGLAAMLANNRVQLRRYTLSGSGGTTVSLLGKLSVTGNQLRLDFGSAGLSTNGYYEVSLDLDGNGTRESKRYFYRLLGDVNGDRTVNSLDRSLVAAAMGQTGTNLPADVNGDGTVNYRDRSLVSFASGTLRADLPLDD